MPNLVSLTRPSVQILGKIRWVYFRFPDFWLIPGFLENCHNSRDSDNIDIKLGAVTKLYSRNKATSKIFDDDVMLVNDEVIVVFLTYSQF